MVWTWYVDVMENILAIPGLEGEIIKERATLLYADDGTLGAWDLQWLQDTTHHLCDLFRNCTGLKPNTRKTEDIICHPGEIPGLVLNGRL